MSQPPSHQIRVGQTWGNGKLDNTVIITEIIYTKKAVLIEYIDTVTNIKATTAVKCFLSLGLSCIQNIIGVSRMKHYDIDCKEEDGHVCVYIKTYMENDFDLAAELTSSEARSMAESLIACADELDKESKPPDSDWGYWGVYH